MKQRKAALFGGTFDPVHLGHVTVATYVAQYIGAEKIIFIPAKRSPLKNSLPVASDNHRIKMVSLATAENEIFQISDYELNRPAPTYTFQTVSHFQEKLGSDCSIYWLIGADCIDELPHWYRITDLIDRCNLSIMYRAGFKPPDFSRFAGLWDAGCVKKLQENVINTPFVDISSTGIRKRLAAGLEVTGMLHPAVEEYIRKHKLYRPPGRA
ncbi:MAG: nicotinate-nucleotide adenylyltransferase [Planctomycetota bacterium]|jgi:nicotinate-nucleotide adenylyltransferase